MTSILQVLSKSETSTTKSLCACTIAFVASSFARNTASSERTFHVSRDSRTYLRTYAALPGVASNCRFE